MWPLFFAGEIGAIVYSWAGGFKIFKTVIKRVESHHHHHEVREKFDSSCVKGAKKTTGGFPPSSLYSVGRSDHHKGCFNVFDKVQTMIMEFF